MNLKKKLNKKKSIHLLNLISKYVVSNPGIIEVVTNDT